MLVQSNKLVGITLAVEPTGGGGADVHHRSSSPPISEALSRAGSSTCVCAYIFHVRSVYSEKFAAAPLVSAAVIPRVFRASAQPSIENARDRDLRSIARIYWTGGVNEGRRYEF